MKNTEFEMDDPLSNSLEIDSDYQRLPSEISERLEKIKNADGMEYEIARENLFSLMKIGGEALSDMHSLALQSQHPRAFEVFSTLMKTMIDSQRELMEMKKIDIEIKQKEQNDGAGEKKTTNNILVCSPQELLEMMKKNKE